MNGSDNLSSTELELGCFIPENLCHFYYEHLNKYIHLYCPMHKKILNDSFHIVEPLHMTKEHIYAYNVLISLKDFFAKEIEKNKSNNDNQYVFDFYSCGG